MRGVVKRDHTQLLIGVDGRLRDELLIETLFSSTAEARLAITDWKEGCNDHRPHPALGNVPPVEFAVNIGLEKQAV